MSLVKPPRTRGLYRKSYDKDRRARISYERGRISHQEMMRRQLHQTALDSRLGICPF